jgi:hypothetical protein
MIFLFIEIYIYLMYPRILVFEKCRIAVLPYPYHRIRQPYQCNLASHQFLLANLAIHLICDNSMIDIIPSGPSGLAGPAAPLPQ